MVITMRYWQNRTPWSGDLDPSNQSYFTVILSRIFTYFLLSLLVIGVDAQPVLGETPHRQESPQDSLSTLSQNTSYAGALSGTVFLSHHYLGRLQQPGSNFLQNIFSKLPARLQKFLLPTFVIASSVTYAVWHTLSSDPLSDNFLNRVGSINNFGVLNIQLEGEEDLVFAGEEAIDDLMDEDLMPELDPHDPSPVMIGALLKSETQELENEWDKPLDRITERQIAREQEREAKDYVLNAIRQHRDAPTFFQVSDHNSLISRFVKITNQGVREAISLIHGDTAEPILDQEHIELWGRKLAYDYMNSQLNSAVEIYLFMSDILGLGYHSREDIAEYFNLKPQEIVFIRSQILENLKNFTSVRPTHKLLLSAQESNLADIEKKFLTLSSRDLKHLLEPVIKKLNLLNFTHTEWLLLKPSYIIDFLDAQKIKPSQRAHQRALFFRRFAGDLDGKHQSFIDFLRELRGYLFEQNIFLPNIVGSYREVDIPASSKATYDELISLLYDLDPDNSDQELNSIIQDAAVDQVAMAQFTRVLAMHPKIKALYLSQVLGLGHMSLYQFADVFDMDPVDVMAITKDMTTIFLNFSHVKGNQTGSNETPQLSRSRDKGSARLLIKSPRELNHSFYEMTPQTVLRRLVSSLLRNVPHSLTVESHMNRKDYYDLINAMKANSLSFRLFLSIFMDLDQASTSDIAVLHNLPEATVEKTYHQMAQQITSLLLSSLSHRGAGDFEGQDAKVTSDSEEVSLEPSDSTDKLQELYDNSKLPEVEWRLKRWFNSKSPVLWQSSMMASLYSFTDEFLTQPIHWDIYLINILNYNDFNAATVYERNQVSKAEYMNTQRDLEQKLLNVLLFESAEPLVSSWQGQSEDMEIKVTELMTHYQRLKLTDERRKVIREFAQLSSGFELSMAKLRLFEKHFLGHNSLYWLLYLQVFTEINKDIPSLLAWYYPSIIANITMQMKKALRFVFDSHDPVLYLNSHVDIFEHLSHQITIEDTLSLDELTRYLELFNDREIYGRLQQQIFDNYQLKQGAEVILTNATMIADLDTSAIVNLRNHLNKFRQEPLDLHIFLSLILKLDQTSEMIIANTYGVTRTQVIRRMDKMKDSLLVGIQDDDDSFQVQRRELNWESSLPLEITSLYEAFSLAEMVDNIKKSQILSKYVAVGLPYLNPEGYQKFEEDVLTTPFEKHTFISHLLGVNNTSYLDLMSQHNLNSQNEFFQLVDLLQYKFFYFFHSGQISPSEKFSSLTDEIEFFKSYFEKSKDNLLSDDETIATTQANNSPQNEP
ncbi:MAG: hypothetical protein OXC40_03835 [Proteobacteria bacterium]|nr:hypothetical protein [Pseudomonadota bacterium]